MFVNIEASGCPNLCKHCSVDGGPPIGEHFTIGELRQIAAEWGPLVIAHEPTAHPVFPEMFRKDICDYGDVLPTCGYGIARRQDHETLLRRSRQMGFKHLSFTFHGLQEHHDWFTGRRGSFDDLIVATRRAVRAGFHPLWQIYVDRKGLRDVRPFVELALYETGEEPRIGIPFHRPSSRRRRRLESLRPSLEEIRSEGIDRMLKDEGKNGLSDPELLAAEVWLQQWRQSIDSRQFRVPFEPETWPPRAPFEWLQIDIRRDRRVYLNPMIAKPILLGELKEGRDVLLARLSLLEKPDAVDVTPVDVTFSDDELQRLHPTGYSLRGLAISKYDRERQARPGNGSIE